MLHATEWRDDRQQSTDNLTTRRQNQTSASHSYAQIQHSTGHILGHLTTSPLPESQPSPSLRRVAVLEDLLVPNEHHVITESVVRENTTNRPKHPTSRRDHNVQISTDGKSISGVSQTNNMSTLTKFVEDLWESIFTPGPTPSLLIATNVTFASLQVVLFALLLATYSIHFIILSCLSAGLWWAINWFARELQASHDLELKEKAKAARKTAQRAHTSSDSDTEVETFLTKTKTRGQPPGQAASSEVEVQKPGPAEVKQRASVQSQGSKSSASTEDEWDKVSEYETEKTK